MSLSSSRVGVGCHFPVGLKGADKLCQVAHAQDTPRQQQLFQKNVTFDTLRLDRCKLLMKRRAAGWKLGVTFQLQGGSWVPRRSRQIFCLSFLPASAHVVPGGSSACKMLLCYWPSLSRVPVARCCCSLRGRVLWTPSLKHLFDSSRNSLLY